MTTRLHKKKAINKKTEKELARKIQTKETKKLHRWFKKKKKKNLLQFFHKNKQQDFNNNNNNNKKALADLEHRQTNCKKAE